MLSIKINRKIDGCRKLSLCRCYCCYYLNDEAIEKHLIERERHRLIVFGRFKPSDIAIKIRKKMNRRVEILDVEEMEPEPAADQNPPPLEQIQAPGPNADHNHNHIPMFPSMEQDHQRPPMFPSLATNQCRRSFPSSRPDFAVTCFPEPDMEERFWQYGYDYEFGGGRGDPTFSVHNYYHY